MGLRLGTKSILVALGLMLVVLGQNCAKSPSAADSVNQSSNLPGPGGLRPIDFFKETRPALLCGQEGYAFLMRNYIVNACASCHTKDVQSTFNTFPFADSTDIPNSYFWGRSISEQQWIDRTTNNALCGPECNLSKDGEVYQGLLEWLKNRMSCPP